jgi:hypothetical protein
MEEEVGSVDEDDEVEEKDDLKTDEDEPLNDTSVMKDMRAI